MTAPQTAAVASSAAQAQAAQAGLVLVMAREFRQAWRLLDPARMKATVPQLKYAIAALVRKYGSASAALAAQFYDAERATAGIRGSFTVTPASPAGLDQVDETVGWSTHTLWQPNPDVQAGETLTRGATEKMVLDAGRTTVLDAVQEDRQARGWARITEPKPCSFCALLATRGAVYKSETTASFEAHDHCRCHVQPVFGIYEPPAQVRQWQADYRNVPHQRNAKAQRRAWRQAYEGRSHE